MPNRSPDIAVPDVEAKSPAGQVLDRLAAVIFVTNARAEIVFANKAGWMLRSGGS